jgi:rubredoxin
MAGSTTIKINFHGGIISPGDLYNILVAVTGAGVLNVSFGLRQQLLIEADNEHSSLLTAELKKLNVFFETDGDQYPNIVSSYPAEEVFINNTWLSEGVYKDILDLVDYQPALKINISDSNQSFTPLLTGNINWVASASAQHFWHLFIRFPRTNVVYEWTQLVYTNDIARLSKDIESVIYANSERFLGNNEAKGEELFNLLKTDHYITKPAESPALLPAFNLPYYEGLNRYNNKYWLGVYRRDELFSIDFLKELCLLCLDTRIGQLCSTPWKTIIVKGIEEKDKTKWNHLLEKYQVNIRHAANELNFQVEDNCRKGLEIKNYLVRALNNDDIRTFGVCIGIKTRKKSEVFSSILIRRKPLIRIFGLELFPVYDILCAHDFNPNERTGFIFSKNNPRFLLVEQLRRSVVAFYNYRSTVKRKAEKSLIAKKEAQAKPVIEYVHQCKDCLTVYDEGLTEPPFDYTCPLCEAPREDFNKIEKSKLGLQPI